MYEEMFEVAKSKLSTINEIVDGLPAPQITVLLTDSDNIYVAVNDIDGVICEKMKIKKDTKVVRMLTMWKEGGIDLSSMRFRKALIEMDKYNDSTDIILQGQECYLIKKLSATII